MQECGLSLKTFTVSFFVHRIIENHLLIEKRLEALIRRLLKEQEYVAFLVGRDGEFDQIVSSAIRRCKRTIRDDNSAHVWVLPYETAEYRENKEAFLNYYDEIMICEASTEVYFKRAYQIRNWEMVKNSDIVIFCVQQESGGAWQAMQYTRRLGTPYLNIGVKNHSKIMLKMKYFENQIPLHIRTLKNIKEITHMKINYTITRKILTAALMIIFSVCLLTGCGSKTDAMEYVSVGFTGYNGNGAVDLDVDYDAMIEAVIGEKPDGDSYEKFSEWMNEYLTYDEGINVSCSPKDGLSNGDTITVKVTLSETASKKVIGGEKKFTVSGLPEIETVDIFKDISLRYEGIVGEYTMAHLEKCLTAKYSWIAVSALNPRQISKMVIL